VCGSPSPGPDTIYVQTSFNKQIRVYKNASCLNGLSFASEVLPNNDTANGDVVYDPASDTLWYPQAYPYATFGPQASTPVEVWATASKDNNMPPTATVPFKNGFGAAAWDSVHNLLFVSVATGPQVSVFANATTMTSASAPAAVITLTIVDGGSGATPRPQEMLYDPVGDRLFVSDAGTVVAVFDSFGAHAQAAVTGHTNPTIAANRYIQGLTSPDGLAYAQPADTLFVGEQFTNNDVLIIGSASTINGPVGHVPSITKFSKPGGMQFDAARGLLFVYDTSAIWVIPNALVASGPVSGIAKVHEIVDGSVQLAGFGIALDTTH
jgi:hypothetical protein